MSANQAELTLILKAKNLAEAEFAKIKDSLSKVAVTAGQVADDMTEAFKRVGKRIASRLGNLASDILSGGSIQNSLLAVGATLAGAMVEGLSAHLLPALLEKVGTTTLFAPLAAEMAAGGVTVGTALSTAIAVGMAALPFVIAAAAVAALVYLVANPEARQKAREVALMIIGRIGDGLRALPGFLADVFRNAFGLVVTLTTTFVQTVVGFWLSIPGKLLSLVIEIPGIIGAALRGVLKIAGQIVGKIIDVILAIPRAVADALGAISKLAPAINLVDPGARDRALGGGFGHAAGGWVGLHGPEMAIVGEKGPEFIRPAGTGTGGTGGSGSGFTIRGVSEREIVDMVDRGLYFRLRRAAPTAARP